LETMIEFTKEANDAVTNNTASDLVKKWTDKRNALVMEVRGELDREERIKAMTMITLLQEQIYTARGLPDNWANEVKYAQTESGDVATCGEHKILLGRNFPAGQRRLVVTPLTRICRQKIFEGAATGKVVYFHGPAGTGKTETMKDTLKDLGWDLIVFNCADNTKIEQIKDAIGEGKPIIFDEFNRMSDVVVKEFVSLIPQEKPAIGITCNPGKDGQRELPDELVSQCISLPMLVPDYALIAEIMLFCEGFLQGESLGSKMAIALKTCSEKLSKQHHYDFGMRRMRALVAASGILGRAEVWEDETSIIAKSVFGSVFDSATSEDREILAGLMKELFGPEAALPHAGPEGDTWKWVAAAMGRVLKLRHGAMLVNVSKDDEEAAVAAVEDAANAAGSSVVRMPGAMDVGLHDFIGKMDGEKWSEGTFTKALREAVEKKAWVLVVCGELDQAAVSFEALNTLLDDNKVLMLETGEKIPLCPESRVVFINKDCSTMSPASISRLGVVHCE